MWLHLGSPATTAPFYQAQHLSFWLPPATKLPQLPAAAALLHALAGSMAAWGLHGTGKPQWPVQDQCMLPSHMLGSPSASCMQLSPCIARLRAGPSLSAAANFNVALSAWPACMYKHGEQGMRKNWGLSKSKNRGAAT